jgi:hypothetical protein
MKTLIILLMSFVSFTALAQTDDYGRPLKNSGGKDPQLEYTLPDKDNVNRRTPETAMYYLKTGFSVGSAYEQNSQFTLGGLGTRRYADEFYYGAELSTHYGAEQSNTLMTNITFGHHFLTWRHRIKPYIGGSFGYAKVSDSSSGLNRGAASGIAMGVDVGFTIWTMGAFSINSGLNIHHIMYGNKEVPNSNFQDLYMMLSVGF